MKKITQSLIICITILKSSAQIPDPCTGSGASQFGKSQVIITKN